MTQQFDDNFRTEAQGDESLVPFDVRDYSGRRAMWILLLFAALFLVFIITMFKLYYNKGVRDRSEPPLITAESTPYKVEPENPGGEVTPNQDKTIYDVMNGTAKDEQVVTTPGGEEPLAMPKTATIHVETPTPNIKPAPKADPKPVVQTPRQPAVVQGAYVVQVASMRSYADAQALWEDIRRNYSDVLPAGSQSDIRRVDLREKGVFYRLRVVGLSNKAVADRLCEQFKARKQSCFVTKG